MSNLEIRQATEDDREAIARIFASSFIKDWSVVSNDEEKIAQAIKNGLVLNNYLVATLDLEVVAFIALVIDKNKAFKVPLKDFRSYFGFFKGSIIGTALRSDFEKVIELEENSAYIDILGVHGNHQKKGLASKLIEYVIDHYDYRNLTLNVTNINQAAIHLYKKHGFQEYKREPVKFAKQKGFSEYIYLRYKKIPLFQK